MTVGLVTNDWLAAVPALPATTGPSATAERLLLLLHYGIDWDSWIGTKRVHYWDRILITRVRQATYRADTLDGWWTKVAADLQSTPRTADERLEAAALLRDPAETEVLRVLREHTQALVLRTRIIAEHRRKAHERTKR